MNFPMQYPIFKFFYWLVNTSGVGGLAVLLIAVTVIGGYVQILRWVANGVKEQERETHLFPPHE